MNKITFIGLQVEGYGSFVKPTSFILNRQGINLIFGENGEGKTTLFSVLCWVLWKVNLKALTNSKVASWKWLRDSEWRGTRGVLTFMCNEDKYSIARHLKFEGTTKGVKGGDKLIITKNGEIIPDDMYKGDQEKWIENLFGMDAKVFVNSILFGQRMKRLVSADNEEKRALLESTFETEWVGVAKDKCYKEVMNVADKLRKITSEKDVLSNKMEYVENEIIRAEKILCDFLDSVQKDVDGKLEDVEDLKDDLKNLSVKLKKARELLATTSTIENGLEDQYNTLLLEYEEGQQKAREIKDHIADYMSEARKCENKISHIESELKNLTDKCPACQQKIKTVNVEAVKKASEKIIADETKALGVLADKIKDWRVELNNLNRLQESRQEPLNKSKEKINLAKTNAKAILEASNEVMRIETSIGYTNDNIKKAEQDVELIKQRKPPTIDIAEMKDNVRKLNKNLLEQAVEFEKESLYYERLKFWDSKGFGSGGLKSFIFNAMLESLNAAVIRYGSRLGVSVRFMADMTKAKGGFQTICIKDGHEVDYAELSGGEQQRVDICLAFAFHDIISHKSNINLLIMDEIFENVDAKGIEVIFDLIRVKAGDSKSVFCITHNQMLDTLNTKSIFIRKEEGISYID